MVDHPEEDRERVWRSADHKVKDVRMRTHTVREVTLKFSSKNNVQFS